MNIVQRFLAKITAFVFALYLALVTWRDARARAPTYYYATWEDDWITYDGKVQLEFSLPVASRGDPWEIWDEPPDYVA